MEIKINVEGVENKVTLKPNFRAEIIFEEALQKSFTGANTSEWIFHMYATLLANTNDTFMEFADFTDWLSANPLSFYEYIDEYAEYQKKILELREKQRKSKKKSNTKGK